MKLFFRLNVLSAYNGESIAIQLPEGLTVYDIDWLAMWCITYKHNFGHVMIPKDLNVPPALGQTNASVSYKSLLLYKNVIKLII